MVPCFPRPYNTITFRTEHFLFLFLNSFPVYYICFLSRDNEFNKRETCTKRKEGTVIHKHIFLVTTRLGILMTTTWSDLVAAQKPYRKVQAGHISQQRPPESNPTRSFINCNGSGGKLIVLSIFFFFLAVQYNTNDNVVVHSSYTYFNVSDAGATTRS